MYSYIMWFCGFNIPGNDLMGAIQALFIETLIYGLIIVLAVVFLLWACIQLYTVDNPDTQEQVMHEYDSNCNLRFRRGRIEEVYELLKRLYSLYTKNNKFDTDFDTFFDKYEEKDTPTFPKYFSRRSEAFLDFLFLALPTLVVIQVLVPTLGFLYSTQCYFDNASSAFSIDIIGHQWYWTYEYHFCNIQDAHAHYEPAFGFDSIMLVDAVKNKYLEVDHRLVIPAGVLISIRVTSTDVIHSWAVPQLGVKVDAVPGRYAYAALHSSMEGVYYGQCSELCGALHGFMPVCVAAVSEASFFEFACLLEELEYEFNAEVVTNCHNANVDATHMFCSPSERSWLSLQSWADFIVGNLKKRKPVWGTYEAHVFWEHARQIAADGDEPFNKHLWKEHPVQYPKNIKIYMQYGRACAHHDRSVLLWYVEGGRNKAGLTRYSMLDHNGGFGFLGLCKHARTGNVIYEAFWNFSGKKR